MKSLRLEKLVFSAIILIVIFLVPVIAQASTITQSKYNEIKDADGQLLVMVDSDLEIGLDSYNNGEKKIIRYVQLRSELFDKGTFGNMICGYRYWSAIEDIYTRLRIKRDSITIYDSIHNKYYWGFMHDEYIGLNTIIGTHFYYEFDYFDNKYAFLPVDLLWTCGDDYNPDITIQNGQKLYIYADVIVKGEMSKSILYETFTITHSFSQTIYTAIGGGGPQ